MNELAAKKEDITEFYDILEDIGSGQFAVVKKVIEKETGTEYAAKFMKKKRTKSRRSRGVTVEQITQEAGVLREVRHEGVIYLHDVFEAAQEYVLVLELLNGGELFEFLSEQEYLTEAEAVGFARQVVDAVNYLHEKHIVHLDIKPENIVLKTRSSAQVKLIDFGLARVITPGETVKEMMGTPEFVAPEIIAFEKIGTPTDMWAVGVLAYVLVSGASPFLGDSDHETYTNITNVDYDFDEEYFEGISCHAKEFVSSLLIKDPRARLTSSECLQHPWLQIEADLLRRRSTVIKTEAFKAFTAKARWKKTLKKVIAVNRMALLGKKDGPAAKNILFESDHSTSDSSDTDTHHETCGHTCHALPCPVSPDSCSVTLNAETHNNNDPTCADLNPPSSDWTQTRNDTRAECDMGSEDCNETANAASGPKAADDSGVAAVEQNSHAENSPVDGEVGVLSAQMGSQLTAQNEPSEATPEAAQDNVLMEESERDEHESGESEGLQSNPTEKLPLVESGTGQNTDAGTDIPNEPSEATPEAGQDNGLMEDSERDEHEGGESEGLQSNPTEEPPPVESGTGQNTDAGTEIPQEKKGQAESGNSVKIADTAAGIPQEKELSGTADLQETSGATSEPRE